MPNIVPASLQEIVKHFPKVRTLIVGDLVADHYIFGQTERISREAPVLIVRHQKEEVKLGGAANCAANCSSLGGKVTVVGFIGKDAMGTELKKQFKHQKIQLRAVESSEIATETKTRVLAGGVSTTRQQMLRIDRGATQPAPVALRKSLATRFQIESQKAHVVIVSDYGAGVINPETTRAILSQAARGAVVCVDSRFGLSKFVGATVCKPNEPELAELTGMPMNSDEQVRAAGFAAMQQLKCEILLLTRGRKGMVVMENSTQRCTFLPVFGAKDAVDVTGAGDTVLAAYALSLGAGANAIDAAHVANWAGSIVVQKQGTATVSKEELLAAVSQ